MHDQDPLGESKREPEPDLRAGRSREWVLVVALVLLAILATIYVNSYVPDYVRSEHATRQNLTVQ